MLFKNEVHLLAPKVGGQGGFELLQSIRQPPLEKDNVFTTYARLQCRKHSCAKATAIDLHIPHFVWRQHQDGMCLRVPHQLPHPPQLVAATLRREFSGVACRRSALCKLYAHWILYIICALNVHCIYRACVAALIRFRKLGVVNMMHAFSSHSRDACEEGNHVSSQYWWVKF